MLRNTEDMEGTVGIVAMDTVDMIGLVDVLLVDSPSMELEVLDAV